MKYKEQLEKRISTLEARTRRNLTAKELFAEKLDSLDYLGFIPYWECASYGYYQLPEDCAGVIYNKLVIIQEPSQERFHITPEKK
jgi:hypothetical protein